MSRKPSAAAQARYARVLAEDDVPSWLLAELVALREQVDRQDAWITAVGGILEELVADAASGEILDVKGCAALLKLSPSTIRKRVRQGRIPHTYAGGDKNLRFVRAVIETWVKQGCPRLGTPRLWSRRHAPGKKGAK